MCRCHKHDVGGMSGVPIHVYQRSSPSRRFSAFRLGNMHIATRRSGIMHCYPPHNQSGKYYLNRVCFAHRTHYFPPFMSKKLSMQLEPKSTYQQRCSVTQWSGYIYYENIVQLYHKVQFMYILPRGCRQKSVRLPIRTVSLPTISF